jgi:hypothetical protein
MWLIHLQVIGPNQGDAYIRMKLKDQAASLANIESDPALTGLRKVATHNPYWQRSQAGTSRSPRVSHHSLLLNPSSIASRHHLLLSSPGVQCSDQLHVHVVLIALTQCGCKALCLPTPLPCPQVQAPLIDLEVRGVPALGYFGSVVWKDVFEDMNRGERVGGRVLADAEVQESASPLRTSTVRRAMDALGWMCLETHGCSTTLQPRGLINCVWPRR